MDELFTTTTGPLIAQDCHESGFDRVVREPEMRLMLAILEDAIVTFRRGLTSHCPERRRHFSEVCVWMGRRDYDWPFSFENVCAALLLDPDFIRARLRAIERSGQDETSPLPARRIRRSGNDYGPSRRPSRHSPVPEKHRERTNGFD